MTKFSGAFPQRLRGQKKFSSSCSGLPTHRHNYCKMLEFANTNFSKSTPPTGHDYQTETKLKICSSEPVNCYNCD
jgi:hypothetical protein